MFSGPRKFMQNTVAENFSHYHSDIWNAVVTLRLLLLLHAVVPAERR
jgi:hypothetical protein